MIDEVENPRVQREYFTVRQGQNVAEPRTYDNGFNVDVFDRTTKIEMFEVPGLLLGNTAMTGVDHPIGADSCSGG